MTHEEAIKMLERIRRIGDGESEYKNDAQAIAIDMAIKALEDSRWIPVTERLPEEGEEVLATHFGGINPNRQVIEHIYENGKFVEGWYMDTNIDSPTFGQRYMGEVTAWMPLPKPYEEGAEE